MRYIRIEGRIIDHLYTVYDQSEGRKKRDECCLNFEGTRHDHGSVLVVLHSLGLDPTIHIRLIIHSIRPLSRRSALLSVCSRGGSTTRHRNVRRRSTLTCMIRVRSRAPRRPPVEIRRVVIVPRWSLVMIKTRHIRLACVRAFCTSRSIDVRRTLTVAACLRRGHGSCELVVRHGRRRGHRVGRGRHRLAWVERGVGVVHRVVVVLVVLALVVEGGCSETGHASTDTSTCHACATSTNTGASHASTTTSPGPSVRCIMTLHHSRRGTISPRKRVIVVRRVVQHDSRTTKERSVEHILVHLLLAALFLQTQSQHIERRDRDRGAYHDEEHKEDESCNADDSSDNTANDGAGLRGASVGGFGAGSVAYAGVGGLDGVGESHFDCHFD